MAIVNEARAILTAEDRASAVLAMVARNFDRLNRAADKLDHARSNPRAQAVLERNASRTMALTAGMGAAAMRAAGPLAGVFTLYGAGQGLAAANREFAQNERAMTRIAVTADASAEQQRAAWRQLQELARDTAQPVDKVREGLDALVASGRSMPDALAFLPAVARTAQASGSEVADIAKTAESVGTSFKVTAGEMQATFDIMAAGGKAGQFELKDMARYLPSLGPAASAIGFQGKKGLADLVAMLQVMRKGAGTAEESVASMSNILNKMESDKTTKAFKDLGVDSEAAFKKARKEGRNLIEVFEDLVDTALKGDRSRLGEIIDDAEFKRGVQALMMYRGEWQRMSQTMQSSSAGTVAQDLARVTANSQATFDRFKASADRLADSLGKRLSPAFKAVAESATSAMDAVNDALQPGETDEDRLARLGNRRKTRAEQSIENARRAQERQQKLDDPTSEYYGMRDGGFANAGGMLQRRAAELRRRSDAAAKVMSDAERQELARLESQSSRDASSERRFAELRLKRDRARGAAQPLGESERTELAGLEQRFAQERAAGLRAQPQRSKAEQAELDDIDRRTREARDRDSVETQELDDYRRRQAARARFLAAERRQNEIDNAKPARSDDVYRDVDALRRDKLRLSADDTRTSSDEMLVAHGEESRNLMAGLMNLAQVIRGAKMTEQGDANVFGLGGAAAREQARSVIETAVRAIAERQSSATGQPVSEGKISELVGRLTGLAERIGEAVPLAGPKGRIEGLPQAAEEVLKGPLTAEVKPDQITAKADVSFDGDVQVSVRASPEFLAQIDRKILSFRGDTRGVSLPGKETAPRGFKPTMSGY